MSEKELGREDVLKAEEGAKILEEYKADPDQDIYKINAAREQDYAEEEASLLMDESSHIPDYSDKLHDDAEKLQDGMEWLEIGASFAGGGVPMMESGVFDDAIRDAVESEFLSEEMTEGVIDKHRGSEAHENNSASSFLDSSGPEFKPKGGKK